MNYLSLKKRYKSVVALENNDSAYSVLDYAHKSLHKDPDILAIIRKKK